MRNFTKLVGVCIAIFMTNCAVAQDKVITFAELPAKAQTFIKTYFDQKEVASVYEDTEYMVQKEYSVYLNDGTELEFFSNGDWEEVKTRTGQVPDKIIPSAITQHIQKQFPSTFVKEIKKKRYGYEVEISNGLDLEFNKNGKFLRIDD